MKTSSRLSFISSFSYFPHFLDFVCFLLLFFSLLCITYLTLILYFFVVDLFLQQCEVRNWSVSKGSLMSDGRILGKFLKLNIWKRGAGKSIFEFPCKVTNLLIELRFFRYFDPSPSGPIKPNHEYDHITHHFPRVSCFKMIFTFWMFINTYDRPESQK